MKPIPLGAFLGSPECPKAVPGAGYDARLGLLRLHSERGNPPSMIHLPLGDGWRCAAIGTGSFVGNCRGGIVKGCLAVGGLQLNPITPVGRSWVGVRGPQRGLGRLTKCADGPMNAAVFARWDGDTDAIGILPGAAAAAIHGALARCDRASKRNRSRPRSWRKGNWDRAGTAPWPCDRLHW